ncbi:MAG: hypothetical protein JXR05_13510 [Flavobacteriaceae bacterium]
MKKEITIILPIELKKREFDSRLLLAYHLVNKGYKVIIGDRAGCERESKNIQNCIYIAKSLAYSQKAMYENFHANNGKVLVLYEEGAYVGRINNVLSEIESAYPSGMLEHVDGILVYGDSFNELLKTNVDSLNDSNVFTVGNPRFDLHKPSYFPYFKDEISEIKKEVGDYILFNGNFVRGNHHLGQVHLKNEIDENKELTEEAKLIFYSMMEESKEQLDSFIKMIEKVAESFPEKTMLVRPHPGEDKKIYHQILSKFKNVRITNEGMAYPWIIGADLVIHQDCTTAVESVFAEKPVISYYPFEDKSNLFWLSTFLSEMVSTEAELIQKVTTNLKNTSFLSEEQEKKITDEIINYKDFSHKRLINILSNFTNDMSQSYNKKQSIDEKLALSYQRFRAFLRWKKGKYYLKTRYVLAYEGIKKTEVLKKIKTISSIENDSQQEIKVSRRGINVFHLKV